MIRTLSLSNQSYPAPDSIGFNSDEKETKIQEVILNNTPTTSNNRRKRKYSQLSKYNVSRSDSDEKSQRRKRRRSRTKFPFDINLTISRSHGMVDDHEPCNVDLFSNSKKTQDLIDRIEDHASRRLQILYCILLLYYKEGITIEEMGHTELQHGRAKCGYCHAAHSSILPNVKDNFLHLLIQSIRNEGLTKELEEKLRHIGVNESHINRIKNNYTKDHAYLPILANKYLPLSMIPKNSHIYQLMNSTVEVSSEVNRYDSLIEGILREKAIVILNRVSMREKQALENETDEKKNSTKTPEEDNGPLEPYEGLKLFFEYLHQFYNRSEEQIEKKFKLLDELLQKEMECYRLEKIFKSSEVQDRFVNLKKYLYELFSLRCFEDKIDRTKGYSPSLNPRDRMSKHQPIIKKLFVLCFEEKEKIDSFTSLYDIHNYSRDLMKRFEGDNNIHHELLANVLKANNEIDGKKALKLFLYETHCVKYFLSDLDIGQFMLEFVQKTLIEMGPWQPKPLDKEKMKLKTSKKILEIQKRGTILPKYESLSGKNVKGKRIGLTDDELLIEKESLFQTKVALSRFKPYH